MIDLHFHALPGIDDGPESLEAAVALCRRAAEEGTTHIVATPHVLREPWLNEEPEARAALLAALNAALGGTPEVLPGCELMFTLDILELVDQGDAGPVIGLNGSRTLLVEFAPGYVPREAASLLRELVLAGRVPVVAHPERNLVFQRDPERLFDLLEKGALAQVTAASLLGEAGRSAQAFAEDLMNAKAVHFVASDAHNLTTRPPRLAAARESACESAWGAEVETEIFETNPLGRLGGLEGSGPPSTLYGAPVGRRV